MSRVVFKKDYFYKIGVVGPPWAWKIAQPLRDSLSLLAKVAVKTLGPASFHEINKIMPTALSL